MNLALLVMAAGAGTRYGGPKQLDPVGPAGETLIDYSVYDAMRAGFQKVVFVIRREIEDAFRGVVGRRLSSGLEVAYVFQEEGCVWDSSIPSVTRKKPWGTAHAILTAAPAIREPFAVINADDFYGRESFRVLAEHLRSGCTDDALVGFLLRNTLSRFGSVKRGVCQVDGSSFLRRVTEYEGIEEDGRDARHIDEAGVAHRLAGDTVVSMNMWGFRPTLFPHLAQQWAAFLGSDAQLGTAEFYIPDVVNTLIRQRKATFRALSTPDAWFGMTYSEDRPHVVDRLRRLVTSGEYPERLWS